MPPTAKQPTHLSAPSPAIPTTKKRQSYVPVSQANAQETDSFGRFIGFDDIPRAWEYFWSRTINLRGDPVSRQMPPQSTRNNPLLGYILSKS